MHCFILVINPESKRIYRQQNKNKNENVGEERRSAVNTRNLVLQNFLVKKSFPPLEQYYK